MAIKARGMRKLMNKLGAEWKRQASNLLKAGKGFNGQRLASKKWPNGRPLGIDSSRGGIQARILTGPVKLTKDGFSIDLLKKKGDLLFHKGRRAFSTEKASSGVQVARPIVGFSKKWLDDAADRVLEELGRSGKRAGLFK